MLSQSSLRHRHHLVMVGSCNKCAVNADCHQQIHIFSPPAFSAPVRLSTPGASCSGDYLLFCSDPCECTVKYSSWLSPCVMCNSWLLYVSLPPKPLFEIHISCISTTSQSMDLSQKCDEELHFAFSPIPIRVGHSKKYAITLDYTRFGNTNAHNTVSE